MYHLHLPLLSRGRGTSTNAHLKGPPPPTPPPTSVTTLSIHERDVNKLFKRQNPRKAAGPDSVSPSTLKHCADQLSPVFTDIFNTSPSPQSCVLSPLLFSLYTNSCTSSHQSVKLLKFADDTTLI
ncbi:hypothetical protein N1851_031599 [Merluccius polli]|uniref:Reverse transcriptase domain-containing protein n=1 Tax=Merluccius polli TaxID=89951 RepID=A0AA47NPV2_MERPO|nr:hypothetical protein N1851_031599 [Merluccius polli]